MGLHEDKVEADGVVTSTVRMLKMSLRDTKFKALWVNLVGKLAAFLADRRCRVRPRVGVPISDSRSPPEFRESRPVSDCRS